MQNSNLKFKTDLKERCCKFSLEIIKISGTVMKNPASNVIIHQLIRSATSIGANLVEAKAASSRLEFKRFFEIALRSANETKYWLNLLLDANLVSGNIAALISEITEISSMLAAGILRLKNRNF